MPEKFEQINNLEVLRQEVADFKLDDINPAELTDEDLETYQKLKNEDLNYHDFMSYKRSIPASGITDKHHSRSEFSAWLSNKIRFKENGEDLYLDLM